MKDIAIYGAGGFGREVACLINTINKVEPKWNLIGFFDDHLQKGLNIEFGNILGNIQDLNDWKFDLSIIIAIGNPKIIHHIFGKITNSMINFPNIIAPDLILFDNASFKLGMGNIISFGSIISCNVEIGDFNLFNLSVKIGHDSKIGSYNVIMPSVNISGEVTIGNNNFMGVSSVILQQLKMGDRVRVGAGSVIMRKTENDVLYVGNPAVKINF